MEKIEGSATIKSIHGLHARPAAVFVQLANKFDACVVLEKEGEKVDGKSIIAILSLGVQSGSVVKLTVEGDDAREAFGELKGFLEKEHD